MLPRDTIFMLIFASYTQLISPPCHMDAAAICAIEFTITLSLADAAMPWPRHADATPLPFSLITLRHVDTPSHAFATPSPRRRHGQFDYFFAMSLNIVESPRHRYRFSRRYFYRHIRHYADTLTPIFSALRTDTPPPRREFNACGDARAFHALLAAVPRRCRRAAI